MSLLAPRKASSFTSRFHATSRKNPTYYHEEEDKRRRNDENDDANKREIPNESTRLFSVESDLKLAKMTRARGQLVAVESVFVHFIHSRSRDDLYLCRIRGGCGRFGEGFIDRGERSGGGAVHEREVFVLRERRWKVRESKFSEMGVTEEALVTNERMNER